MGYDSASVHENNAENFDRNHEEWRSLLIMNIINIHISTSDATKYESDMTIAAGLKVVRRQISG